MKFAICFLATCIISTQFSVYACAQEEPANRIADQIYDVGGDLMFVRSADSSAEHFQNVVDNFLKVDISLEGWTAQYPNAMNREKPIIFYGIGRGAVEAVQLPFDDMKSMREMALKPEDVEPGVPFSVAETITMEFPILGSKRKCHAIINDGHWIASETRWNDPGDLDASNFDIFKDAKPLSDSLDPRMINFFDRTGLGCFVRPQEQLQFAPFWFSIPEKLSAKEQELADKVTAALESANAAVFGVTYEEQQINGEIHLKYSRDDVFDELFDFATAKDHKFEPTIGLPADDLLLSFSTQTAIFRSPDVGRLLLKAIVPGLGRYSKVKQDSAFFHVTSNLIADSWKDIAGVRVALYQSPGSTFSALAILDARDPNQFFDELQKLMAMVEPKLKEGLSPDAAAEIRSLIEDLGSRSYATRERAETRLSLAAMRAHSLLKEAASAAGSAEARMRANRILKRLATKPVSGVKSMNSLNFWANYSPDIAVEKGTNSLFDESARVLRIIHPSTFTQENSRNATKKLKQLFGDNWDRVPVVRVGDRFVVMIGGDDKLLQTTIDNLKRGLSPIKKVAIEDAPYFKEGNLQIHMSFQRIRDAFGIKKNEFMENYVEDYQNHAKLSSASLHLLPDYWQGTINVPIEDLAPCFDCGSMFSGR